MTPAGTGPCLHIAPSTWSSDWQSFPGSGSVIAWQGNGCGWKTRPKARPGSKSQQSMKAGTSPKAPKQPAARNGQLAGHCRRQPTKGKETSGAGRVTSSSTQIASSILHPSRQQSAKSECPATQPSFQQLAKSESSAEKSSSQEPLAIERPRPNSQQHTPGEGPAP